MMGVHIVILVEGATEAAFKPILRDFIESRLPPNHPKPRLDFVPQNGRVPTRNSLKRLVEDLLTRRPAADAVIALTDVHTGTKEFANATDAKRKMKAWVGDEPRFYPHVALHDFEAWLLPYWSTIQKVAGSNRKPPGSHPEKIDHDRPPAKVLAGVFLTGSSKRTYSKIRDAQAILQGQDLTLAARACPELQAFLNTLLTLSGGEPLP